MQTSKDERERALVPGPNKTGLTDETPAERKSFTELRRAEVIFCRGEELQDQAFSG